MIRIREVSGLKWTSLGIFIGIALWTAALSASEPAQTCPRRTDRSANFLLNSDLTEDAASQLLVRMEKTLTETANYWRRPMRGLIECYVIDDLKNWPDNALPHPLARLVVDRIGGITLVNDVGAGINARKRVLILAASREGVAEHEVVHAYCGMVFGVTGPAWYREGIAQVFAYGQESEDDGLHCPKELIDVLTGDKPKAIQEVVKGGTFTQRLSNSLTQKVNRRENLVGLIPVSDWSESDIRELETLKKEYTWSWLACHLLYHNPNYQSRFKSLGRAYLAEREDRFSELFGAVINQLSFEYDFTVQHFAPGYRVDLCHWDWDKRFRCATSGHSTRIRVSAARGYQASGLIVPNGEKFQVRTQGTWTTGKGQATDAAGNLGGNGRLEGIVLNSYRLSKPFDIGANGTFQPPSEGLLYLRCRDDWAQLGDNTGSIVVTLRQVP